jgi:hypothetical protein
MFPLTIRYEVTERSLILFALEAHTTRVLRRVAVDLSSDPHRQRALGSLASVDAI